MTSEVESALLHTLLQIKIRDELKSVARVVDSSLCWTLIITESLIHNIHSYIRINNPGLEEGFKKKVRGII